MKPSRLTWCTFELLDWLNCESKDEDNKSRSGGHSLACSTSKVEGHVQAPGWGLRRLTSKSITHTNLYKPNDKLVSAQLEHLWCTDEPWANTYSQDSPWPGLGGSHHIPPYSYFVPGHGASTQMSFCLGSPKIPKIRTFATLEAHNFAWRPPIEVRSKTKL